MENIKYYNIVFRLASPLAVGSGERSNTDSDAVLDSRGLPMIPATAIAGVIRHYLDMEGCNDLFGYIDGESSAESRIRFYDAVLVSDDVFTTVRDCVGLKDKVGVKGAKFDLESVETGAEFAAVIEMCDVSTDEEKMVVEALGAADAGFLRIGAKTSRGYGQLKIISVRRAEFAMPADRKKWLDFDLFDPNANEYSAQKLSSFDNKFITISLSLKQQGAVSIRSYTTKNQDDIGSADYIQLSLKDGTPVIPGTSWAGAFRERFRKLSDSELTGSFFGKVDNEQQKKSLIMFDESVINDGVMKLITRNSIDRFSSGTKDGALYTEKTCYNGSCELKICISVSGHTDTERAIKILCAVICDLDRGYLSVGGLTAVGRGMFSVEKMLIGKNDVTNALKAGDIASMAQEAFR